ncbi:MAG: DNA-processing protein DprA [Chitinophagales bacterium]
MPNLTSNEKLYQIALTLLTNVGSVLAKNVIAYCGSVEGVFKTSKSKLEKIPGIGKERAEAIAKADVMKEAEAELEFIAKYNIQPLFFTDAGYPQRLKNIPDSPVMLYYKGNADLNNDKIISVVGTRRATEYGKEVTKKLIADLSGQNILVVSGLAYGIDIAAHHAALDNNLKTVAVLGHGLNTIYPSQHKAAAKKIAEQGGLLTEYRSVHEMHPSNFPSRNKIVAALCDATIVVESDKEGGAVITANLANSYNRDVFAYPGKATDRLSSGCNALIKSLQAKMIENASDLLREMNWQTELLQAATKQKQRTLAIGLNEEEQAIYNLLNEKGELVIDVINEETQMNVSLLAATLLEMEMNNLIVSLPGKRYKLI